MRVLVSLYKGYGLGDAVQMSAVLRHLKKHRPDWRIDFQAESGRESVGRGHVSNVFCYGEPYPSAHYDLETQIILYDTFANWHDRPNTRVTSCLHERFGIEWDPECARYRIVIRPEVKELVRSKLGTERYVAIHYSGVSAKHKKDLSIKQATEICEYAKKLGFTPLILDWFLDPLSITYGGVRKLGLESLLGRSVEVNCAVITECKAFIGIDSGPSKCASATETPALVIWTGHHPAPFHDPAPNTTHLVPVAYNGLEPVCGDKGVIAWFEANHEVQTYDSDLVQGVKHWLQQLKN